MKTLSLSVFAFLALTVSQTSYANTQNNHQKSNNNHAQINSTLTQIIALVKDGEQMNVKRSAEIFGEPDLYGNAVYGGWQNETTLRHYYEFKNTNNPLKSVRYETWLDMSAGFHYIKGAVEYEFRPAFCPSVSDYEQATGTKAMRLELPSSPDLLSGRIRSYTAYSIEINENKRFSVVGCRVSVFAKTKLS